jgi:hypothetical protein
VFNCKAIYVLRDPASRCTSRRSSRARCSARSVDSRRVRASAPRRDRDLRQVGPERPFVRRQPLLPRLDPDESVRLGGPLR